jgi:hypothetical protein
MWKHLRGPRLQTTIQCGAVAVLAGVPVIETSGLAVAVADGGRPTHVSKYDMVINTDYYEADYLVPGSVWRVACASLTAERGTPVVMSSATEVDAGSSTNKVIGKICDHDVVTADTECDIVIVDGETIA